MSDTLNRIGTQFVNVPVSAGSVLQIVNPTVNTNGIWIRTCGLRSVVAGGTTVLFANATKPASANDSNARAIFNVVYTDAIGQAVLPHQLFVPAGLGLWLGAVEDGGMIMTYDVLS
jgi:hypothetical protein